MRSLLIVRAVTAASLDHGLRSGADALILDLRADIDLLSSAATRHLAREFLRETQLEPHRPLIYVRVAAVEAETTDDDLAAIVVGEPDGFVLGQCRSGRDVQHLGVKLAVHEAEYGLADGEGSIIAGAGTTAESLFGLGSYTGCSPRLMGLSWDARSFAGDLGTETLRNLDRTHTAPLATARSMTLIAARAAGVAAIDGPEADLEAEAFRADCEAARRDGFNAKIAISPDQVAIINEVFDREA